MYAKGIAKKIREDLKAIGYNSKKISVVTRGCGYSDSIRITIKDVTIPDKEIIKIADKYESIRYDEYTGEILEGANLYIFVEYDYDVMSDAAKPYMKKAIEIFNNARNNTGDKTELIMEKNGKQLWYYGGCCGRNGQCFEAENAYETTVHVRSVGDIAKAMMFFDAQH